MVLFKHANHIVTFRQGQWLFRVAQLPEAAEVKAGVTTGAVCHLLYDERNNVRARGRTVVQKEGDWYGTASISSCSPSIHTDDLKS